MLKAKKIISGIMLGMMALSALLTMAPALAVDASDYNAIGAEDLGIKYAESTGLGTKDVRATVASILRVAMGLLGIVAVVIVLIGGFTWMTAGGNEEKVGEAKKWIFAGVIGLAIVLSAFALSTFVINSLITATSGGDTYSPPTT